MSLVLVVHNVRSAHNVGSLLRTADGLGLDKVYLTGFTPYPESEDDARMPHTRRKIASQIHKTALGAEYFLPWQYQPQIIDCINMLEDEGFNLVALEQTSNSVPLETIKKSDKVALIVGNELKGLDKTALKRAKQQVHIPMKGKKESFNVAVAAAIAMYHLSKHSYS